MVPGVNGVLGNNEARTNGADGHNCRCAETYFSDWTAERKVLAVWVGRWPPYWFQELGALGKGTGLQCAGGDWQRRCSRGGYRRASCLWSLLHSFSSNAIITALLFSPPGSVPCLNSVVNQLCSARGRTKQTRSNGVTSTLLRRSYSISLGIRLTTGCILLQLQAPWTQLSICSEHWEWSPHTWMGSGRPLHAGGQRDQSKVVPSALVHRSYSAWLWSGTGRQIHSYCSNLDGDVLKIQADLMNDKKTGCRAYCEGNWKCLSNFVKSFEEKTSIYDILNL